MGYEELLDSLADGLSEAAVEQKRRPRKREKLCYLQGCEETVVRMNMCGFHYRLLLPTVEG